MHVDKNGIENIFANASVSVFAVCVYIQALRAFRRAEIVFDVVLFESCVGGVAVAMTVASIFYFEFWFVWGVRQMPFLLPFGGLCGS